MTPFDDEVTPIFIYSQSVADNLPINTLVAKE
jgi:hypothetical protein